MKSAPGMFVVQDDNLIEMSPTEFSLEADFQELLVRFPALLVGEQIDPANPRRWLLIKREQNITIGPDSSNWSIDHLFLDQDGIPTLVEVKRRSDARLRREVVGQMLDYAANCANYWTVEMLQLSLAETCRQSNPETTAEAEILRLFGPEDDFWQKVKTNLQAERIRLLFVADHIPLELRKIVEFLNRQMDPVEVLAIELRHFTGAGIKTLVPMIFGQTQESLSRKSATITQRWDESRLIRRFQETLTEEESLVAKAIYEWMKKCGYPIVFGTGRDHGSVYPLYRLNNFQINPAYLSTDGKLWLQFAPLLNKPIFSDDKKRRELADRFSQIRGVAFTADELGRYKTISLNIVANDPNGLANVLDALEWIKLQVDTWDSMISPTPSSSP